MQITSDPLGRQQFAKFLTTRGHLVDNRSWVTQRKETSRGGPFARAQGRPAAGESGGMSACDESRRMRCAEGVLAAEARESHRAQAEHRQHDPEDEAYAGNQVDGVDDERQHERPKPGLRGGVPVTLESLGHPPTDLESHRHPAKDEARAQKQRAYHTEGNQTDRAGR